MIANKENRLVRSKFPLDRHMDPHEPANLTMVPMRETARSLIGRFEQDRLNRHQRHRQSEKSGED